MKWVNHSLITTSAAYIVLGNNPFLLGITAAASVFPDAVEMFAGSRIIKHRTISHSLFLWCFLAIISYFFIKSNYNYFLIYKYFFFGIFGHLLEDMLTKTGIPVFYDKKRIALRLFRTGSWIEYAISGFCFLIVFKTYF